MGRLLDLATGKNSIGVAIDDQAQHHARIILLAAAAFVVDRELFHIDALDRLDDEMDEVVLWHPVPQVGGHQERLAAVGWNESCHINMLHDFNPKSDRLLGRGLVCT